MNDNPRARSRGLLTQSVGDHVVVHDQERQQLHTLNATAALVWQHCDGARTVDEITALLASTLDIAPDEAAVRRALEILREANLLEEQVLPPGSAVGLPRRTLLKRAAAVMGGLLVPPAVTSFGTPASAARPPKVQICHNGRTMEVTEAAVPEHLAHGDTLGPCGSPTTAPPTTAPPTTSPPTTEPPPTTVPPTTVPPTTSPPTTEPPPTTVPPTTSPPPTTAPPTTAPPPTTSPPTTSGP